MKWNVKKNPLPKLCSWPHLFSDMAKEYKCSFCHFQDILQRRPLKTSSINLPKQYVYISFCMQLMRNSLLKCKCEKKSSSKIMFLTPSIFWHGHFILMLANYFEGVIAPFDFKYFIKKFVCTTPTCISETWDNALRPRKTLFYVSLRGITLDWSKLDTKKSSLTCISSI
jgi:hypothetical protein